MVRFRIVSEEAARSAIAQTNELGSGLMIQKMMVAAEQIAGWLG